jgi:hypothetical protein
LQQRIKNVAVDIDGTSQPVFLSLDRHHHLIKLPFIDKVAS